MDTNAEITAILDELETVLGSTQASAVLDELLFSKFQQTDPATEAKPSGRN